MKRFVIPAVVLAASVAVYLPALKFDFVYDDPRQIEMMESRFTWSQVPSYFTTDVWSYVEDHPTNYYRPIFVVWMLVTYQLFGLSHPLWHATAILVHAMATLLLYFLARRLTGDRVTAGVAGLLFAVYPIHVEAVAWVSGATEPLCAIPFFAALLCYIAARQEASQEQDLRRVRWWRIGSVAAFAVAIFAKETASVLPALIFAYAWLFPESALESSAKRARRAFSAAIPYLQALIVYLGMRWLALGAFSQPSRGWSLKSQIATLPVTVWFYMRELLWPLHLSVFPPVEAVRRHIGLENFVLPAIAVALGFGALLWISSRSPLAAFCSMLLVLPLLPVLNLHAFQPEGFAHDRYLYIPSAGFCILLALAFRRAFPGMFTPAFKSWPGSWRIPTRTALAAPLIAVLALLTIRESQPWKDQMTLARHVVAEAPDSLPAQGLLASALMLEDRYAEALPLLEPTLAAYPKNEAVNLSVAMCHLKMGNWSKAAAQFRIALALVPDSARVHLLLGMAEQGMGQVSDAEADMREAVRLRPQRSVQYRGYRFYLADLLERKGDLKGALEEYNRELEEYPDEAWVLDRAIALKKRMPDQP
jgi:tetratricopeptide (TPR) repeat protein